MLTSHVNSHIMEAAIPCQLLYHVRGHTVSQPYHVRGHTMSTTVPYHQPCRVSSPTMYGSTVKSPRGKRMYVSLRQFRWPGLLESKGCACHPQGHGALQTESCPPSGPRSKHRLFQQHGVGVTVFPLHDCFSCCWFREKCRQRLVQT